MTELSRYEINRDVKFDFGQLVDLAKLVDAVESRWHNQTLCRVNDCVVRLGVMEGEFHWHKHENEDEFFYVVEGVFIVETEQEMFRLEPRQAVTIASGVLHTTRTEGRAVILMVEKASVVPTGDEP